MKRFLLLIAAFLVAVSISAQPTIVPDDQPSVQAAIDAAEEGDTILVEEGTYYENINFKGKAITVASRFILDGDTSHISKTILDGSQPLKPDSASVVLMISGEDTTSVLTGLTITGGKGTYDPPWDTYGGGGLFMDHSGGKICNNIFEQNQFGDPENIPNAVAGSAINLVVDHQHRAIVRNNIIRNNIARGQNIWAGAIALSGGGIVFEGNTIVDNANETGTTPGQNWGTLTLWYDQLIEPHREVVIRNNTISGNTSGWGAGISGHGPFHDAQYKIYNNLITDNKATYGGAMAFTTGGSTEEYEILIYNNTVVNNQASYGNCVVTTVYHVNNLHFFNNIMYSESAGSDFHMEGGSLNFQNNLLKFAFTQAQESNVAHMNNTYLAPEFDGDTYMPAASSPAVGRAADSVMIGESWFHAPEMDMDGDPRPGEVDRFMDIGAHESAYAQALLDNADLLTIKFRDAKMLPSFHPDSLYYTFLLPDTVSSSNELDVLAVDAFADLNIVLPDLGSDIKEDWIAAVTLNSSDESVQKVYQVLFDLAANDATLSTLSTSEGMLDPPFSKDVFEYHVYLSSDIDFVPELTYTTSNPLADAKLYPATNIMDSTDNKNRSRIWIKSALDRKITENYYVKFHGAVGINQDTERQLKVQLCPNPAREMVKIETREIDNYLLEIHSISGQLISQQIVDTGNYELDLSNMEKGVYLITIRAENYKHILKLLKL